jgi:hypothetical protein
MLIELTIRMKEGFSFKDVEEREFRFLKQLERGEYKWLEESCKMAYYLPGTCLTRLLCNIEDVKDLERLTTIASAQEDMATFQFLPARGASLREVASLTFAHGSKTQAFDARSNPAPQ